MKATLSVSEGAFEVGEVVFEEVEGNGNGLLEPGERIAMTPLLVSPQIVEDISVTAETNDPHVIIQTSSSRMEPDERYALWLRPEHPLEFLITGDPVSDPYAAVLTLRFDRPGEADVVLPVEVGVGTRQGLQSNFDSNGQGWTHAPLGFSKDIWHLGDFEGAQAFRCLDESGGTGSGVACYLESPPFLIPPGKMLTFDHIIDVPNATGTKYSTVVGGWVEISVNGADWDVLQTDPPYNRIFIGDNERWFGHPMFGGKLLEEGFQQVEVDLSDYSGLARFRFVYISERFSGGVEGWIIGGVHMGDPETPVEAIDVSVVPEGQDVIVNWRMLTDTEYSSIRLWRNGPGRDFVAGAPYSRRGSIVDPGGLAARAPYWLEGLRRDGAGTFWGPWRVSAPQALFSMRILENPSRGRVEFVTQGKAPPGAKVQIYDVHGRVVWEAQAGSLETLAWQGRTPEGSAAASGIYFLRLTKSSQPPRKFVYLNE